MKTKESKRFSVFCFVFSLSLLAGCGQAESGQKNSGREAAIGERFNLSKDEKVSVKDTRLTVQLKSVRRTWHVDGKGETADADIIMTLDKREQRQWVNIGGKVTVGDYIIELSGADPFGKTSCELIVERR